MIKAINEIVYNHTLYGEPIECEYTEPWEVIQSIYINNADDGVDILHDILELESLGYIKADFDENDITIENLDYNMEIFEYEIISASKKARFINAIDMKKLAKQIIEKYALNEKSTYTEIVSLIKRELYHIEIMVYGIAFDGQCSEKASELLENLGAACMGYICKYLFKMAFRALTNAS